MTPVYDDAFIIAVRRTIVGRPGGVHRHRRLEDLAAKAISAALDGAGLRPSEAGGLILGNGSEGGNPARLAALAAGLPDLAPSFTIDRQCASGLEAVLAAIRLVAAGEADILLAAGAESVSTAPWRLSRPRGAVQPPRFIDAGPGPDPADISAAAALALAAQISRGQQDAYALQARRAGPSAAPLQIAAFGPAPHENRDELPVFDSDIKDLPVLGEAGDSGVTAGNCSHPGDGAACVIVVSGAVHRRLGSPPALRLTGAASIGARPGSEASSALQAVRDLQQKTARLGSLQGVRYELSETSAVQALAFGSALELAPAVLNASGGMLASGRPAGAAGAMLVGRIFATFYAHGAAARAGLGLAATGAAGGQGLAALFQTVER